MSPELIVTLTAVFLSTALLAGLFASTVLGRTAPELKRLRDVTRSSVETEGRGNGFQTSFGGPDTLPYHFGNRPETIRAWLAA